MESLPNELLCQLAEQSETPRELSGLLQTNRELRRAFSGCWTRWPFKWQLQPKYLSVFLRHLGSRQFEYSALPAPSPITIEAVPAGIAAQLYSLEDTANQPILVRREHEFFGVALNTQLREAELLWLVNLEWLAYFRRVMSRHSELGGNTLFDWAPLSWNPFLDPFLLPNAGALGPAFDNYRLHILWLQQLVTLWDCLLAKALRLGTTLRLITFVLGQFSRPAGFGSLVRRSLESGDLRSQHYYGSVPGLDESTVYFEVSYSFNLVAGEPASQWIHLFTLGENDALYSRELELVEVLAERGLLRGLVLENMLVREYGASVIQHVRQLVEVIRHHQLQSIPVVLTTRGSSNDPLFLVDGLVLAFAYGDLTNIWLDLHTAGQYLNSFLLLMLSGGETELSPPRYATRPEPSEFEWLVNGPLFEVEGERRITVLGATGFDELRLLPIESDVEVTFLPEDVLPPLPLQFSNQVVE